jgi:asparagine synthase (glutamine-hydrolysing)
MFAFAIWDDLNQTLFLARDPFGIKPLYYSDDGKTLRFASQVKALMAGGQISTTVDLAGHVGFFVLGSVPEPFTLHREVRALPAGTTLLLRRGKRPLLAPFFDLRREMLEAKEKSQLLQGESRDVLIKETLSESVAAHMVADVPVGLFLSAGLDSSTVAGVARGIVTSKLRSITLGFKEYQGTDSDEVPLAERTAGLLGTSHVTRWVAREEFESDLEKLTAAMDQPSIDGVNTYFVSKAAAESGMKVALSGLGGDELFGGYPSFTDVPRLVRTIGWTKRFPWLGRAIRQVVAPVLTPFVSPKYGGLVEYGADAPSAYLLRRALYMPWEVRRLMGRRDFDRGWDELQLIPNLSSSIEGLTDPRQQVSALELSCYMRNQLLRDADWAGMAHSLEIRVPLVDLALFRKLAPIMQGSNPPTKSQVAKAALSSFPPDLLHRPKTGFSIPVHEWIRESRAGHVHQRKLRAWSHIVHQPYKKRRALVLLSDAFGGHGGIALYNRDFITALCAMKEIAEVVALPRLITREMQPLPEKLTYIGSAANSKLRYIWSVLKLLAVDNHFDMVFCCHVNLLAPAVAAKARTRSPLTMFIYGIDAWTPLPALKRALLRRVDRFVSISDVTRSKFVEWSHVARDKITLLPNAIHTEWYGPGSRKADLVARYGLQDKVVLLTLGRLVSSERYKGFDEVLDAMPSLLLDIPNLVYLIVGDGSDRRRLESKVSQLGIKDHVRFTGHIPEHEKADHYRLADAYVMPSRGEGFGFVLLEAMACGIPAVASSADGGREAVREGEIGILVNPDSAEDVQRGIREALRRGRQAPPPGLAYFHFEHFKSRTWRLVENTVHHRASQPAT